MEQERRSPAPRSTELEAAIAPLVNALAEGDVAQIAAHLHNDLQEAASRLHEGVAPLLAKCGRRELWLHSSQEAGRQSPDWRPMPRGTAHRWGGGATGQLGLVGARPGIVARLRSASELGEDGAV